MSPLGRALVDAQPQPIFKAEYPCMIECWVISKPVDDQDPSVVFVQWTKELCDFNSGTPLEIATKFSFDMEVGDQLWAITQDIALMGFVVKERR